MATMASSMITMIDEGITAARLFLETYGWFILIGGAIGFYLWRKYASVAIRNRSEASNVDWENKKFDTSEFVKRQETMEEARRKMQEKYDTLAQEHAQKQKELEEKRLEEKMADWENHKQGRGYRSKTHLEDNPTPQATVLKKTEKKPLRNNDYNPLTGSGGSSGGVRPGRGGGGRGYFGGSGGG